MQTIIALILLALASPAPRYSLLDAICEDYCAVPAPSPTPTPEPQR